ncbi:MAG: ATP-binding cassette domain-containing protein [Bacteroidetes bacterium]|nr:ATP-binding cassette domain-containing protein [Bacteroidota bacterium]
MLKVSDITKSFPRSEQGHDMILENLNLEISSGEFGVLLGGNGSGKSTLLKIIAGFIKQDKGIIAIDSKDITAQPAYRRANRIFYLHQLRDLNLSPSLTILEVFMIALSQKNFVLAYLKNQSWRRKIKSILNQYSLGLENKLDQQIKSLSGGEHQLMALILAAERIKSSSERSVLLLDEHTAHLDSGMAKTVMEMTNDLVVKYKITTLMVTHSTEIAQNYGDQVYFLKNRSIHLIEKKDITSWLL